MAETEGDAFTAGTLGVVDFSHRAFSWLNQGWRGAVGAMPRRRGQSLTAVDAVRKDRFGGHAADRFGGSWLARADCSFGSLPMLPEPQRRQIFEVIEVAGLDRSAFAFADDGITVRLEHRALGSRFAFRPDETWRFLGHCSVADCPERIFDRSWMGVTPFMSAWLIELKWHLAEEM
jgi:hypothetical protein